MPSTDRKLELKAKTSVAQTASQAAVYARGLIEWINGTDPLNVLLTVHHNISV
jgi:hypothetical protein